MASVLTLISISLIVLFGCHNREVGAGRGGGGGRGKGWGRGTAVQLRELKFTTIISGQATCRLEQTMGQRLYREKPYCDTRVIVKDPRVSDVIGGDIDQFSYIEFIQKAQGRQFSSFNDPSLNEIALNLNVRSFCAHRYVLLFI